MSKNPDSQIDTIYAGHMDDVGPFQFDQKVVDAFPDMIKRSVPGYSTIVHMTGYLAAQYAQSHSACYDLGCSLGTTTLAMRHKINAANCKIIAVDNSPQMIERCRLVVDADSADLPVELVETDIQQVKIDNASVCTLNFTLQFIELDKRDHLLQNIFDGMRPKGILIISEKLLFEDADHQTLMNDLHHYFKRSNGYSDLEIAQKRDSLENVLVPETFVKHKERLEKIGFTGVELWFQCFNFSSFIAFKP